MNNAEVLAIINDCSQELESIKALLIGLGDGARPSPYIKKYAVIRATGSIEVGFKQIIADKVDEGSHIQVKNFIKRKIRESSCNPKLSMIENMLSEFDSRWREKFDELLALEDRPALKGSLTELVNARNEFAHGGDPDIDIDHTISCFEDGKKVLSILDDVVNYDFDT
ncbi:HEPN domain-containing protein [Rheinheimera fenheensis]|uniref:HEPN domain-containing protein n=1 Tax=Rheinheimera fenheensis TaxID=3152295 RepID=UPI0032612558